MRRLVPGTWAPIVALAVLVVAPGRSAAQPYGNVPLDLLLDVCVLPADDCDPTRNVMDLEVEGEQLKVELLRTEVLRRSVPGTGTVQTELTLRPMRAYGPKEVLAALKPGARLRLRASTRLADRMLLVSSVQSSKAEEEK